jgi:hypothetical protein
MEHRQWLNLLAEGMRQIFFGPTRPGFGNWYRQVETSTFRDALRIAQD